MKKTVFHYQDYKKYLSDFIKENQGRKRGTRAALAEAARCQAAYISQVLNGPAQLSLEQAESVASRFCMFGEFETEFFLLLVQLARAGTPELQRALKKIIEKRAAESKQIDKRDQYSDILSEPDQIRYFSEWDYSAVHALLSIEAYRTPEAIMDYLRIRPERVAEILDFLKSRGLARKEGEAYRIGETRLMIGKGAPVATKNHINSRLKSLSCLQSRDREGDKFYSSVVTISAEDRERVKILIADLITEVNNLVKTTKPEHLLAFNVDFFRF